VILDHFANMVRFASVKSALGQNAKYSSRVDVFRFASNFRRSSMRSVLRICANSGHQGSENCGGLSLTIINF
jgi:hypothetical protein